MGTCAKRLMSTWCAQSRNGDVDARSDYLRVHRVQWHQYALRLHPGSDFGRQILPRRFSRVDGVHLRTWPQRRFCVGVRAVAALRATVAWFDYSWARVYTAEQACR